MGSDAHYPEEAPARWVDIPDFEMDVAAVTNDEFAAFVSATGYVTTSEHAVDSATHPDMPDDFYRPGSLVFQMTPHPVKLNDPRQWWSFVPGACWQHPEGPQSTLEGRGAHPVVHVSYIDALAYAHWAGRSLPSEAQWEYAAQAAAGDATLEESDLNIWRGNFPQRHSLRNAPPFTTPSLSTARSENGMSNMLGNVWEWCCDPFDRSAKTNLPCCAPESTNPKNIKRVLKGGSYLCADTYCRRYRPAARLSYEEGSATGHIGFRCISASGV